MIDLLRAIADVVPHFGWLVAIPLLVLTVQVLFLRVTLAMRRDCLALEDAARAGNFVRISSAGSVRRWPAVMAAMSLLAVPAVAAWSISTARGLCLTPLTPPDPSLQATNFSRGLAGMFNAVPWSINLLAPTVLLATMSLSLWVSVQRRRRRLCAAASLAGLDADAAVALLARPSLSADNLACIPLLLLGLGLFPVLSGAWVHTLALIQGYAGVARLPPAEKAVVILAKLDEAHALFATRAWLAYPGIAMAALLSAFLLLHRRRRARVSNAEPGALTWKATVAWSVGCVNMALLFFVLAEPFRAENNLPWPAPRLAGDVLRVDQPDAPKLQGPDDIERSPILQLSRRGAWLDGYAVDVDGLEDGLRTRRETYRLLHPGQSFDGVFLVLAAADTPMRVLGAYLAAAARAGSKTPLFTFTKRESQERPILGPLTRVLASAARATVLVDATEPDGGAELVRLDEHDHYGSLARRLVALRRAGKEVALAL